MARPHFSPEWGQNGCDSPSPYDYDGHINDRLGRGLRGQTSAWGMDRRVPFLAHKLPGAQSCLPGFDAFSPRSWEASYNSQDGQHGGSVPHKSSGGFTVAHPGQACAPSSPLVPGQVPFLKGSSRSGNLEPRDWLSVETETQAGRVDVEPSDSSPNLGSVWRSGSGPFCFTGVAPMPALVPLSSPVALGIDAFAHPWPNMRLYVFRPVKLIPAVLCRVKVSGTRLLLIAPFWPSQTWFSELIPLLYRPPWEIPIRRDQLSQLQGRIWHPQPEIWKLWVWPIQGQGPWWIICLSRFRRPSPVPGPLLRGSCMGCLWVLVFGSRNRPS